MVLLNLEYFLNEYPKTRPALDDNIKRIYDSHYRDNREGKTKASSIAQKLETWMHHKTNAVVEEGSKVIEVGAGTLNHLKFAKGYRAYDIVEPFKELYESSDYRSRVRSIYADIKDVKEEKYEFVISIATLEHLTHLPLDIARAAFLLEPNGTFVASIPSEGGFLWGAAWRLSTGLEFYVRHKLNYGNLMRHEHVNDCREIQAILGLLFEVVKVRRFGIGNHLSLYQCFECRSPRLDLCQNVIDAIS